MTTITDYTSLQSSVGDFLMRADLTAVIPTFIQLCEAQMNRKLRCRQQITKVSVSVATEFVTAPTDIAQTVYFKYTDYPSNRLVYCEPQNMPLAIATVNVRPRAWTLEKSPENFRFAPIPDQSYAAEYLYFAKLPPLASNPTNWLLALAPDAYLYGALLQSAPYLRDDERIAVWGQLYATAVNDVMASNKVAEQLLRTDDAMAMAGAGRTSFNINTGM